MTEINININDVWLDRHMKPGLVQNIRTKKDGRVVATLLYLDGSSKKVTISEECSTEFYTPLLTGESFLFSLKVMMEYRHSKETFKPFQVWSGKEGYWIITDGGSENWVHIVNYSGKYEGMSHDNSREYLEEMLEAHGSFEDAYKYLKSISNKENENEKYTS